MNFTSGESTAVCPAPAAGSHTVQRGPTDHQGTISSAATLVAVAPPPLLRMHAHPILRKFGLWSYSIYIWQQPFYILAYKGEMSYPLGLAPGKAIVRHYQTNPPTPTGHYTVEVVEVVTASRVHTHQVPSESGGTTVANERREKWMSDDTLLHSTEFPVKNATAAQKLQRQQMGKELGTYDERTNSCVTHVAGVLRAAGEDIAPGPLAEMKYLKGKGFQIKQKVN